MDDDLIEQRFELVDDQFEHLKLRVATLEDEQTESVDAKASKHGRWMNWAMLGLFVLEVVIGVVEIWMLRHA